MSLFFYPVFSVLDSLCLCASVVNVLFLRRVLAHQIDQQQILLLVPLRQAGEHFLLLLQ
jgi:hypothetical protein